MADSILPIFVADSFPASYTYVFELEYESDASSPFSKEKVDAFLAVIDTPIDAASEALEGLCAERNENTPLVKITHMEEYTYGLFEVRIAWRSRTAI